MIGRKSREAVKERRERREEIKGERERERLPGSSYQTASVCAEGIPLWQIVWISTPDAPLSLSLLPPSHRCSY